MFLGSLTGMKTALITHPDCLEHVTPDGHPEQVARLSSVLAAIEDIPLARHTAEMATDAHLARVHTDAHIAAIKAASPTTGQRQMDADTWMSPGSLTAAYRAAGAAVQAVDLVLGGQAPNAFCAVRPPGHHAEREQTMGFCLFGTVAVAAKHALDHHGLSRVAIVDFDVHHGNGTQDLLQDDPRVLFISSHQMPLWPGTGDPSEVGPHDTVINIALPPDTKGPAFRAVYEAEVFPRIAAFDPELLLISAGFDAHQDDPLAGLALTEADFTWVTERLCDLAAEHCDGRVVSCLEGGYNLTALAKCARAHVKVLEERSR